MGTKFKVALAFFGVIEISELLHSYKPKSTTTIPWYLHTFVARALICTNIQHIFNKSWMMYAWNIIKFFSFLSILIQVNISRLTQFSTWRRTRRHDITDNGVHINATWKSTMSSKWITNEFITKVWRHLKCDFWVHNAAQNKEHMKVWSSSVSNMFNLF